MQSERRYTGYRFLSLLLTLTLVIALLSPAKTASAAATPSFTKTSQSILVGDTYTIQFKNKIGGAHYTWSSTDKSIAKVNQKGVVTGLAKGTATIRCKIVTRAKSYRLDCKVTVRYPANEVTISNKIDYLKIGGKYDLNQKQKPSKANEVISWSTSDSSILSVDKKGVVTAKGLGIATITAATDKVSDSVTIYVVEQEKRELTKKDIVDGTITINGKSYGDLSISSNVGDVRILLNNVTVGGTLRMEAGSAYTVMTDQCTINKVDAVNSILQSFSVSGKEEETPTPSLVAGYGSIIVTIDSECNISVKQSSGAVIQSFSVTTSADGTIQISLEGFKGDLVIDSSSTAAINIAATACEMNSATVKNATEGQQISLTDTNAGTEQASMIKAVNMAANAALKVDVKAEEVVISKEVSQANVTISQPVVKLSNEGSQTSLTINSEVKSITSTGEASAVALGGSAVVNSLRVEGSQTKVELLSGAQVSNVTTLADNTMVNLSEGATIQKVNAYGNNTAIEGTGRLNEAVITGNDAKINTEGTNVQVALGTTNVIVNGVVVKEEDKVAIATPTPTPAPTVAPTPKAATPTPKASATPSPKPSATPSPKPTVLPTPTSGPVVNPPFIPSVPDTSPTATPSPSPSPSPSPTPSPSPSPTPIPTELEKHTVYNDILASLHSATASLITTQNTANYTAVRNSFVALKDALVRYEELDTTIPPVTISDSTRLVYDYADYAEILIANGKDYGLSIRQYYESANTNSQTFTMTLAAANRLIHMVHRINTEGVMFQTDVIGVFTSLTGSATDFRTAMNKLLLDNEVFEPLAESEAAYYQKGILDLVNNDERMKAYYNSGSLTFFQALDCFLTLNGHYGILKEGRTKTEQYQQLLNNLIDSLPVITPIYIDGYYAGAEYDLSGRKETVLTNIEAIMNSIDPATIWGEENITLTLRGKYEDLIIEDIIRKLYTTQIYENGEYEKLNYYRVNRAALATNPDAHVIHEAIVAVVCCVRDVPEYNIRYLERYEALTKDIINAAKDDGVQAAEQVYTALIALYDAKLDDPEFKDRWREYPYPVTEDGSSYIDKDYYLSFIQSKLQPLSDKDENGQPIDSKLYLFDQMGEDATAHDLGQAIYVLKSAVEECNRFIKNNYDTTKTWVFDLMTALENQDMVSLYSALSSICQFMQDTYSETEGKSFALLEQEYAAGYMLVLWEDMLREDSDSELKRFYHLGVGPADYSRYIGELENGALWNIAWWLSEEADLEYLKQASQEYMIWEPIRKDINTAIFSPTASNDDRNGALKDIITRLSANETYRNDYLRDMPGISKLNYKDAELFQYLQAINQRRSDGTRDWNPERTESWYRYPLYEYDQMLRSGQNPGYGMLAGVSADILRAIVLMEQRAIVHEFCENLKAKNAAATYQTLTKLYVLMNDVFMSDDNTIHSELYAEAYLRECLIWINEYNKGNDTENPLVKYYFRYLNHDYDSYSNNQENELMDAYYTINGLLTEQSYQGLSSRFADAESCKEKLEALLNATAGDDMDAFAQALRAYFAIVDKSIYEVPVEAEVMDKYIPRLKLGLLEDLNYSGTNEQGDISHLNYYYMNKDHFNEGERLLEIYECSNWIVNKVYRDQLYWEEQIGIYRPYMDELYTCVVDKDSEGLYAAIVALYQYMGDNWGREETPIKDGTATIDKDYFLQIIEGKLQQNSEQDENGNPCNSALYLYYMLGQEVTIETLEAALEQLKDAVWEADKTTKTGYDQSVEDLQKLINGIEENNLDQVYEALDAIGQFMNSDERVDDIFVLKDASYTPLYRRLLKNTMENGDSALSHIIIRFTNEEPYSRSLGEDEWNALYYDIAWLMNTKSLSEDEWLRHEFALYEHWTPVMNKLDIFRYRKSEGDESAQPEEPTATDEERLQALGDIFTMLGSDQDFVNRMADYAPGLGTFEPDPSLLWDYWGALTPRIEDASQITDQDYTYDKYGLHTYDLAITSGELPSFDVIERAFGELVESILLCDHMLSLNQLITSFDANNTEAVYEALTRIQQCFDSVYERENSRLLDYTFITYYLEHIDRMRIDPSEDNPFRQYCEQNGGTLPQSLKLEDESLIRDAVYYVHDNILNDWIFNYYMDIRNEVTLQTANLDALIAVTDKSVDEFSAALVTLVNAANRNVYFNSEDAMTFYLDLNYSQEIQQGIKYSLTTEHYSNGDISWLYYYHNNREALTEDKEKVILECLKTIMYSCQGIPRDDKERAAVFTPLITGLFSAAETADNALVLERLVQIYAIMKQERGEEWSQYASPVDGSNQVLIDMDVFILCIKDEATATIPVYGLLQYWNKPIRKFSDIEAIIYALKNMVADCQLSN